MMEPELFEAAVEGDINAYPFCEINNPEMVNIFYKVSPIGNSLLHIAASSGQGQIIELIARRFPSLITNKNNKGDTALHVAARAGKLNTVRILVDHATSFANTADESLLKMINKKGNTALHEGLLLLQSTMNDNKDAQGKENADSVIALVCYLVLADPEVSYCQNNARKSPLCLAVESDNVDILEFILMAVPESVDLIHKLGGKSPVHVAIERRNLDAIKTITKHKTELYLLSDEKENSPLHYAASVGFLDGVRYLLENSIGGALERNKEGLYPVHVACQNGHVEVVRELLTKWPEPSELLCNRERNILHHAADSGKPDVVMCILKETRTDKLINEVDDEGNTPLHLAASHGYSLVVGLLLMDKCSKSDHIVNNQGQTAYDIAKNRRVVALADKAICREQNVSAKMQDKDTKIDIGESTKASSDEKHSTNVVNWHCKNSREPNLYGTMMTLSILFMVHYYHIFRASRGSFIKNCLRLTDDLGMKSKPPPTDDVKDRINGLLVVATIIVAAAFGACHQMPPIEGNASALQMFVICDTTAMYVSLMAAIILCWAQLVDFPLASLIVFIASVMVGFALYMMCFAFLAAMILGTRDIKAPFLTVIIVIQAVYFPFMVLVSIPLIIPFSLKELAIRCTYFVLFYCYFVVRSFMNRNSIMASSV